MATAAKKAPAKKTAAKAPAKAAAKKAPAKKAAAKAPARQIPFVDYLVLGARPYLRAHECRACGARYFDRRNACASCFGTEFRNARVKNTGIVTSFTIVSMGPQPYISAVVDCDGTSVRCTLMNVTPDPDHVRLGMKVKLATHSMGTDAEGTEAIGYGFEPA